MTLPSVDMEPWICGGCGEETTVSHWRSDSDGMAFHAGPDAPPSDESALPENYSATNQPIAGELLELAVATPRPGPRHTVGVHHFTPEGGYPYLEVWCSCGWLGEHFDLEKSDDLEDLPEIPDAILEAAARSWRFHVRLSNRVYRIDKRLRKRGATGEPVDLSRTPEFAIEEARRTHKEER